MDDNVWDMSRSSNRTYVILWPKAHTMSVAEYARDSINGTYDDVPLQPWHNTLHYSHGTTCSFNKVQHHCITHRRCSDFLIEGLTNGLDKEQSNGHRGHQTSQPTISYSGAIWSLLLEATKNDSRTKAKWSSSELRKERIKELASCTNKISTCLQFGVVILKTHCDLVL